MKKDQSIIHYSDLGQLRSILSWCKSLIAKKINDSKLKHNTEQNLKKITAYLEEYVSQERNEAFHSRLQLYSKDELGEVLTDTKRLTNTTLQVKNELNIGDFQT